MEQLLFSSYCASVAGMAYYAGKSKLQDDFEKEIKDLREFDFNNEDLRDSTGAPDKRAIVLANLTLLESEKASEDDQVLFQR